MNNYTIEKADHRTHKDRVLALLKRNLDITEERYDWNYVKGPVICWIAKDASGEVVGSAALFLRDMTVNGKPFKAGIAGDFAVDKEHRAFGPAMALQKSIIANLGLDNVDFVYTIPNEKSGPLLQRLGYREISVYRRFVKILKSEYKEGKNILPASMKGIASSITDFALEALSKERRYRRPFSIKVETPAAFDKRFDDLSTDAKKRFNVAGTRTADFLNWRYRESPYRNYAIFAVSRENGVLAGYIVYYIYENVAYIADILFDDTRESIKMLLSEFCNQMRDKGAGSISIRYVGGKSLESSIKEMNFIEDKRTQTKMLVYPGVEPNQFLLNKENWYFLEGDNDV